MIANAYKQLDKVVDLMYQRNLLHGKIIKEATQLVDRFNQITVDQFVEYSDCTILAADTLRELIDKLEISLRADNYKVHKVLEVLEDIENLVIEEGIC